MAILRFRIYWEEDESVYRDVAVKHTQNFLDLHDVILKSFEFDNKHKATFYRSNDGWQFGREISLEEYEKPYVVAPLLMADTIIGDEIKSPNQKFVYEYDFNPCCVRTEGLAPSQYGTKGLVDKRLAEMEEKYDLQPEALNDNFGSEGESDAETESDTDELAGEGNESNDGY